MQHRHNLAVYLAVYIVLIIYVSPWRVWPQLTPEEDFGKKFEHWVEFTRKFAIILIISADNSYNLFIIHSLFIINIYFLFLSFIIYLLIIYLIIQSF